MTRARLLLHASRPLTMWYTRLFRAFPPGLKATRVIWTAGPSHPARFPVGLARPLSDLLGVPRRVTHTFPRSTCVLEDRSTRTALGISIGLQAISLPRSRLCRRMTPAAYVMSTSRRNPANRTRLSPPTRNKNQIANSYKFSGYNDPPNQDQCSF